MLSPKYVFPKLIFKRVKDNWKFTSPFINFKKILKLPYGVYMLDYGGWK